jgi:hypothetical protein
MSREQKIADELGRMIAEHIGGPHVVVTVIHAADGNLAQIARLNRRRGCVRKSPTRVHISPAGSSFLLRRL